MKVEKRFLKEDEDVICYEKCPTITLKDIDSYLHKFGLEVIIVDNGSSDTWFAIKKRS
jgi:glycosyltransferase involved in cell wall biosynthesis